MCVCLVFFRPFCHLLLYSLLTPSCSRSHSLCVFVSFVHSFARYTFLWSLFLPYFFQQLQTNNGQYFFRIAHTFILKYINSIRVDHRLRQSPHLPLHNILKLFEFAGGFQAKVRFEGTLFAI